jgi:hypothetical protein
MSSSGVRFSMNSPKEPEPGHGRVAESLGLAGRILRMTFSGDAGRGCEWLVRMEEGFIGG